MTHPQAVLFSMSDVIGAIEVLLAPFTGPTDDDAINYRPLVDAHLEALFFGQYVPCLMDAGVGIYVPSEIDQRIGQIVADMAGRAIQAGFGVIPNQQYNYQVIGDDVIISRRPNLAPAPERVETADSIQQCLDDGGWVSEKLRLSAR